MRVPDVALENGMKNPPNRRDHKYAQKYVTEWVHHLFSEASHFTSRTPHRWPSVGFLTETECTRTT